jgi:hypothetical protein
METKLLRKTQKVFYHMSKTVRTRSADQCRSHHQKMLKFHKDLDEIMKLFTRGAEGLRPQPSCENAIKT